MRSPSLQKILSRCFKEGECLLWQGAKNNDGYGNINVGGKYLKVHRLVYSLVYGPTDKSILHRCDKPSCVNPHHLFEGTQDDNMKDAKLKGRLPKGNFHPKAVLNTEKVLEIKNFFALLGNSKVPYGTIPMLAKQYGVSYETIQSIRYGKSWSHINVDVVY